MTTPIQEPLRSELKSEIAKEFDCFRGQESFNEEKTDYRLALIRKHLKLIEQMIGHTK